MTTTATTQSLITAYLSSPEGYVLLSDGNVLFELGTEASVLGGTDTYTVVLKCLLDQSVVVSGYDATVATKAVEMGLDLAF